MVSMVSMREWMVSMREWMVSLCGWIDDLCGWMSINMSRLAPTKRIPIARRNQLPIINLINLIKQTSDDRWGGID